MGHVRSQFTFDLLIADDRRAVTVVERVDAGTFDQVALLVRLYAEGRRREAWTLRPEQLAEEP